jgi:hypothetical protein
METLMGLPVCLCLDKDVDNAKLGTHGRVMVEFQRALDDIGKSKDIAPAFSSFIFEEFTPDFLPLGAVIREETYYDAQEGFRVVSGLIAAIGPPDAESRNRFEIDLLFGVKSSNYADHVLAELKELERCLKLAAEANARFLLRIFDPPEEGEAQPPN